MGINFSIVCCLHRRAMQSKRSLKTRSNESQKKRMTREKNGDSGASIVEKKNLCTACIFHFLAHARRLVWIENYERSFALPYFSGLPVSKERLCFSRTWNGWRGGVNATKSRFYEPLLEHHTGSHYGFINGLLRALKDFLHSRMMGSTQRDCDSELFVFSWRSNWVSEKKMALLANSSCSLW